jgi:hypothetical protein
MPARVRLTGIPVKHLDAQAKAVLVARLREKGVAISLDVRRAAAALLVAERTVWRSLDQGDTDQGGTLGRATC